MASIKETPVQIVIQHPVIEKPVFQQQAFGPWTTNDPKVQRTIVRTNASSGFTKKKFQATYPPAPTIAETRTALAGGAGFEFAINIVTSGHVSGYNVYSSTTNNPNVATLLKFLPQPPIVSQQVQRSIKFQDVTAASPFYWVASVNDAGRESSRLPIAGTAAPTPPPTGGSPSGGSGSGSGGGGGGGHKIFI